MPINKIVFIGEYTTNAGPWVKDWFIVLAEKIDVWREFPYLDITDDGFWTELGRCLNCEIAPALILSKTDNTNVIYPIGLQGQELFKVVKKESASQSALHKLFKIKAMQEHVELSDKVSMLFSA